MAMEVMECPICTEVYKDPRVLPCGHTYCLRCIEEWSKDKEPGDNLPCPLCRKEFTLPSNGVSDLPKNFIAANFLQRRELLSVETMPPSYCDQHKDEHLKIYCFECKSAICTMCYIKSHKDHKCSDVGDVGEVGDAFREQMASDVDNIVIGVDKCREMLEGLEKQKEDFDEEVKKAGVEITEKADELKRMIDVHKEKLMNELSSVKQKKMSEIESLRKEIKTQLLLMEGYQQYVDELRQKGTACEIARAASGLHDKANNELLKFDVNERSLFLLGHAHVSFTPSNFVVDDASKTMGKLQLGKTIYLVELQTKRKDGMSLGLPGRTGTFVIDQVEINLPC